LKYVEKEDLDTALRIYDKSNSYFDLSKELMHKSTSISFKAFASFLRQNIMKL